jgi:hypothetical protein
MSNLLHIHERITELLGVFAYQAKAYSASGKTDFNKVSEDVLVPLFKQIFDLPNLRNLNSSVKKDFPAIDLADDESKIAFQITATSDSQKIKDTLKTFVEKELYNNYPRLIFYIISEKKDSYPEKSFADIIQGKFEFNIDTDIIDFRDLVRLCNSFQIDVASKIKRILEANFGLSDYSVFNEAQKERCEDVTLNLIDLYFPKDLYIANLDIDRDELVKNSMGALRMNDPTRTIIRHFILEQLKLDFYSGWHLYKNQLITFHNPYDDDSFLSKIIDKGTIESISAESFYTINKTVDVNRENVFKTLLRKTLQEQLYQQQVEWQFDEGLFIFIENGNEKKGYKTVNRKTDEGIVKENLTVYRRYESWKGEKESSRAVLEIFMKSESPDEPWYFKHHAFEAKIKKIENKWFLLVLPEWFFSFDGFTKSNFHADDLKWLKRKANTEMVFNDFRFIHYFLENKGNNLLQDKKSKRFLRFGDYVTFENAPFLYDEAWNPPEEKKKKKKADDTESDETSVDTLQANLFDEL